MAKMNFFLMFDKGHNIKTEPLSDSNISPKDLSPFQNRYKQKQFKKTNSIAASSALINDTDNHSDDDDIIDRSRTREELNSNHSELNKFLNYKSEYNMQTLFFIQISETNHLN